MAVENLTEAAIVLSHIRDELERVLYEVAPMEDEYIGWWKAATDPATGDRVGVAGDRFVIHADAARPYFDVMEAIGTLAGDVDRRLAKAQADHWRTAEVRT